MHWPDLDCQATADQPRQCLSRAWRELGAQACSAFLRARTDQAASPDDSNQTDQSEKDSDADQPADGSDQPAGNDDAGPQDQDQ